MSVKQFEYFKLLEKYSIPPISKEKKEKFFYLEGDNLKFIYGGKSYIVDSYPKVLDYVLTNINGVAMFYYDNGIKMVNSGKINTVSKETFPKQDEIYAYTNSLFPVYNDGYDYGLPHIYYYAGPCVVTSTPISDPRNPIANISKAYWDCNDLFGFKVSGDPNEPGSSFYVWSKIGTIIIKGYGDFSIYLSPTLIDRVFIINNSYKIVGTYKNGKQTIKVIRTMNNYLFGSFTYEVKQHNYLVLDNGVLYNISTNSIHETPEVRSLSLSSILLNYPYDIHINKEMSNIDYIALI